MESFVDGKTYFDVDAVAAMFQVHPETVKRWAREDKLERKKGSGRMGYIFSEDTLNQFAAGNPKYSTQKVRYDKVIRVKRKERADVLMDIMAQLARMKVRMYYDGVEEKKDKAFVDGWSSCADEIERYIRDEIRQMG